MNIFAHIRSLRSTQPAVILRVDKSRYSFVWSRCDVTIVGRQETKYDSNGMSFSQYTDVVATVINHNRIKANYFIPLLSRFSVCYIDFLLALSRHTN